MAALSGSRQPRKAVLISQTLEDPLRRAQQVLQPTTVFLENPVDHRSERVELQTCRRLRAPIPRKYCVLQDSRHGLAVETEPLACHASVVIGRSGARSW